MTTSNNIMAIEYKKEIASLNNRIAYCNEAICSNKTESWERKEYQAVKLDNMKRKINLIKILNNESLWS